MENIIYYTLIFCIGTLFGSFFTLAVYRIPLHQDITHKRSYCPNCNHSLSFWDMIPILSYIFLKGKCRYCKNKIRIRYLLLEVLSGLIFVLLAMSIKMDITNMVIDKFLYLTFILLYVVGIIIIAGIDKEKQIVSKPVMLYEIILLTIYMIYLYIVENASIHRYVIYLFIMLALLLLDTWNLKRKLKSSYVINIIVLSIIMAGFTYEWCFLFTAAFTLLCIGIKLILHKINDRIKKYRIKDKNHAKNIPIAFYLCCSNIIVLILTNMVACGWLNEIL